MNPDGAVCEERRRGAVARPTYRDASNPLEWEEAHLPERAVEDSALPASKRRRRGLWWSLGGAGLSAVGFICLALFEQYNSSLSELRADLKHFNEVSAEFVKRDSLRRYSEHIKESRQELHESRSARKELERELALSKKDREEMLHEIQRLRERLASVEGRQAAAPVAVPPPASPAKENSAERPEPTFEPTGVTPN